MKTKTMFYVFQLFDFSGKCWDQEESNYFKSGHILISKQCTNPPYFMVFYAPQHKDNTGEYSKHQGVCKVLKIENKKNNSS